VFVLVCGFAVGGLSSYRVLPWCLNCSDWNPQNDVQAQARAHRIGQTRSVTVYRLLTKKSYEMVMFKAASLKLGLDYAIMHNLKQASSAVLDSTSEVAVACSKGSKRRSKHGKQSADRCTTSTALDGISTTRAEHVSSLTKRELENLLKHGAYDIFLEEKEGVTSQVSNQCVEESIEQILAKSSMFLHHTNDNHVTCTRVVWDDEAARGAGDVAVTNAQCNNMRPGEDTLASTQSSAVPVLSTAAPTSTTAFTKASFIAASKPEHEIAIDDPDFWSKVVGLGVDNGQGDADGLYSTKRRNRVAIDTYRDPTDSLRSIYGELGNAYATDSDDDSADKRVSKRRKTTDLAMEQPDVVAEYTVEHLNTLYLTLSSLGYGQWSAIRLKSKLFWPITDIINTCDMLVGYSMILASIVLTSPDKAAAAGGAGAGGAGDAAAVVGEVDVGMGKLDHIQFYRMTDPKAFQSLLIKYKLCKLITSLQIQGGDSAASTSTRAAAMQEKVVAALASYLLTASDAVTVEAKALADVYDSCLCTPEVPDGRHLTADLADPHLVAMRSMITKLEECSYIQALTHSMLEDAEAGRVQKKLTWYKGKLAQLEDMYELYLLAQVLTNDAIPSDDAMDGVDVDVKAKLAQCITSDTMLLATNAASDNEWTVECDVQLVQAVGMVSDVHMCPRMRLA
jgi:hypothetical protein